MEIWLIFQNILHGVIAFGVVSLGGVCLMTGQRVAMEVRTPYTANDCKAWFLSGILLVVGSLVYVAWVF